jgi:NitT/TauT family transport system ATP-binding protein
MINFKNVTFSYKGSKENVLKDFSLHIKEGDRVWLSGASGRGKTTVLRLIMGLEKAKKGKIEISENAKISAVFQEDRLIPFVSVRKNISLFSNDETAEKLLSDLGLNDTADMAVNELSGGMKRRVALARALSKDFNLLILDEALNGLDEETKNNTASVINKYTENKTVVFVSHSGEEAALLNTKEFKLI